MFDVTEQLVTEDPDLQMVFLYVGDLDSVCHAFWPYRFPDSIPADPQAPEDVKALGRVIEHLFLTSMNGLDG